MHKYTKSPARRATDERLQWAKDEIDPVDQAIELLQAHGWASNLDGDGRIVVALPEADEAETEQAAEAEANDLVHNIQEILLADPPVGMFNVEWQNADGYVAIIEAV